MSDPNDVKGQARRLRAALADHGFDVAHSLALELVAQLHGHRDWNTAAAAASGGAAVGAASERIADRRGRPNEAIPIMRIFDQAKAYEFYRDFLGFEVAWEHRFGAHLPLYAEVVLDGVRLHLSEHHGDASPGGAVIIEIDDARALQRRLVEADYEYARPGVEQEEWGLVVTVHDPFHNRLMFTQRTAPPRETGRVSETASPIVESVDVAAQPGRAFVAFTEELAQWWDPRLTADAETFRGVEFATHVGGDIEFVHDGGQRYRIGTVTTWEPGQRLAMRFCLAMDTNHPSTLTVDFAERVGGAEGTTHVTLTHAGWEPGNVAERAKFTEWPQQLERYRQHVLRGQSHA